MLKIAVENVSGGVVFDLAGKISGPWVKELEQCWRSTACMRQIHSVRIDLSSVTFIDEEGKALLEKMYREGVELIASGCLNKCIVEGIAQSVERKR